MQINKAQAEMILKNLILSILYTDSLDEISDTNIYQKKIKNLINQLSPELLKVYDYAGELIFFDYKTAYVLIDEGKAFIKTLAGMTINDISLFNNVIDMIKTKKDYVIDRLGIKEATSEQVEEFKIREMVSKKLEIMSIEELLKLIPIT